MLAQVGLEAYILGTLFHYVVKKDAKLEEFRSAVSQACSVHAVLCKHCLVFILVNMPQHACSHTYEVDLGRNLRRSNASSFMHEFDISQTFQTSALETFLNAWSA